MQLFDIHDSSLGKSVDAPGRYDSDQLFRIPRSENRLQYDIHDHQLPFIGFDVWHCYEVSFLTDRGFPVNRVLKLVYPADSQYLVESKSLKTYLNGFNMDSFGATVDEAVNCVQNLIKQDLSRLLETDVQLHFIEKKNEEITAFDPILFPDLLSLLAFEAVDLLSFERFTESPDLLVSDVGEEDCTYSFSSDILRSNCRVTNQPDWGDLFVSFKTRHCVNLSSVLQYLVSFRKENHFHEEVVEMIYKRFSDAFEPSELMVAAMYTRRGGIDINPIRCSEIGLVNEILIDPAIRTAKTLRQ